ncbi:Vitamin B12 import ATP-binding protein BtuD [compost metagenome]
MMLGLAAATEGSVSVLGLAMPDRFHEVLPRVGALVEGPAFYPFLSGAANLRRLDAADPYAATSTRRARVEAALERVGLTHAAGKKVRAYSLGMKQRLGIANALLSPRELLVLDEPTNGLDPQGTREVRSLVRSLAADGATVFVSSHLLAEVEQICTHAAVMSAGRLVAQGTLAELRDAGKTRIRLVTPDAGLAEGVFTTLGMSPAGGRSNGALVYGDGGQSGEAVEPEAVVAALVAAGVRVRGFAVEQGSLEDRFVALTGEGFDIAQ